MSHRDEMVSLLHREDIRPSDPLYELMMASAKTNDDLHAMIVRMEAIRTEDRVEMFKQSVLTPFKHPPDGRRVLLRRIGAFVAGAMIVWILSATFPLHPSATSLLRAGSDRCEDKPDGSQLCWIPVWTKLPSGAKH